MKSFRRTFATRADRKNMLNIGSSFDSTISYTKSDFMTPSQVKEKFGITTDQALAVMKTMYHNQVKFVMNGHLAPAITNFNRTKQLHLHPMATELFKTYLEKQKG